MKYTFSLLSGLAICFCALITSGCEENTDSPEAVAEKVCNCYNEINGTDAMWEDDNCMADLHTTIENQDAEWQASFDAVMEEKCPDATMDFTEDLELFEEALDDIIDDMPMDEVIGTDTTTNKDSM